MQYDHKQIEQKWREVWERDKIYATPDIKPGEDKFYSLYSFPYPSGAGLHVGHVEGMVANDVAARFARMRGKKVLLPMGWDSFGLPAENYAIKTGIHPQESTEAVIPTFKSQIKEIGISVDWDTEVAAHWPSYYKWTQWIFLKMYEAGLAYKDLAPVNWCPKDQTVLANEQVIDGRCERCDSLVEQKMMEQWFYKIRDYAERLHQDLDKVDWPNSTKQMQRNWIGRSEGAVVTFSVVKDSGEKLANLDIFTTAHDTIHGVTFMVLAPEHPMIVEQRDQIENWDEVAAYIEQAKHKSELDRQMQKEKAGVQIKGWMAVNPITAEQVPIFIADYVLFTYGTGAIMAVPGHDDRDGEFARKYDLPIKYLVEGENEAMTYSEVIKKNLSGFIIKNAGEFSGMDFATARREILNKLVELQVGAPQINYRLRDWLLSRQRYWGCPIPIVYDPEGKPHAVKEEHLPVPLPRDVDFIPTGYSPLARSAELKQWVVDHYGEGWTPEVDTMDTFVDSSWYFFRHTDAQNEQEFADKNKLNAWLPTDLYMIGAEHIVLHLLYARFFTKFLFDEGYINFDEPFYRMRHMGTVLGPDGRKMSKRWGNVINPTDIMAEYGADTLRMYEMFMGPLDQEKVWNDSAVQGIRRFTNRIFALGKNDNFRASLSDAPMSPTVNALVGKVARDTESLRFNTAIAEFMKVLRVMEADVAKNQPIARADWEAFLITMAPYAPYITEELWQELGHNDSIHGQSWPKFDENMKAADDAEIVVQVNGKVRARISVPIDSMEADVMSAAMAEEAVTKYVVAEVKKTVYVPNKLLSLVV